MLVCVFFCSRKCALKVGKGGFNGFSFRWWSSETVAVVTGANKGIGLEIVRQLAKEGVTVVLTARDASRGKDALAYLKGQGLNNVNFHPLDVGSDESIKRLTEWLRTTYGGIDILVKSKIMLMEISKFLWILLCSRVSETFSISF